LRILQVHTRYLQAGGEDVVVQSEADLLRSAGHHVEQHLVRNPPGVLRATGSLTLSAWNPWSARELRKRAQEEMPDLAHVHNTWYALSPSILRGLRQAGVPVVMTLHNYRLICANALLFRDGGPCRDCVGTHPWHGVRHRCYRGSAIVSTAAAATIALNQARHTWEREVDLFLALSEFAKHQYVAGGIPESKIRVKANFVVDSGQRETLPSESKVFLYVGRISREKGVDVALDAWKAIDDYQGFEFHIVGDGPLRSELAGRNVPNVRFLGSLPHEDVAAKLADARALLLPSIWYEGQPMVVLEALASGLPVLGSDLGGITELLGALGAGWLVTPSDHGAWSSAILRLRDDDMVDTAGRSARALYESRFTPETGLSELEEIYQRLA